MKGFEDSFPGESSHDESLIYSADESHMVEEGDELGPLYLSSLCMKLSAVTLLLQAATTFELIHRSWATLHVCRSITCNQVHDLQKACGL